MSETIDTRCWIIRTVREWASPRFAFRVSVNDECGNNEDATRAIALPVRGYRQLREFVERVANNSPESAAGAEARCILTLMPEVPQ